MIAQAMKPATEKQNSNHLPEERLVFGHTSASI